MLVDAGAERALREQGTSLLPVGVVEVEGDFEAGDAVDVGRGGRRARAIGKGISNYSAEELRQVKGLKSRAGARAASPRERGSRAPRLLRAGLTRGARVPFPEWRSSTQTVDGDLRSRRRRPRTCWRRSTTAARTPRCEAIADELEARVDEILEANAGDLEDGRAAGLDDALLDRLALDEERVAPMARRRARHRRAARPGRRGARVAHALQRARAAQGARAAGRGRDRLRGAPERDRRRGRARDQVRQRGRAARVLDRRALERRAGADRRRRGRGRRPAGGLGRR